MVFSSHIFFFYFLPVVLLVYHLLPRRGQNVFLTLASFLFYGWANPWFVLLMMLQTVVDWAAGRTIAQRWGAPWGSEVPLLEPGGPRTAVQRGALLAVIVMNLAVLGFFKYFHFGVESWNAVVGALGWTSAHWRTALQVTLPLGISFYTLHSLSYAIDVYRGEARAIDSPLDSMCYIAMFPQLVAGPIIRFKDVQDQFLGRTQSLEKFARGVAFVSLGLGKKILLANPCGQIADTLFNAAAVRTPDAWYGAFAYALQIYFDFSGYSDMAIGLGLMLGWVFAKNFDSPYCSASLTEFWRRWHISLSTLLRDFLYIPLGGNRRGPLRNALNLAVVMLLGGLWHGAAWNFVIWGALHGVGLAMERMLGPHLTPGRVPRPLRVALTFTCVLLAWVFFRSRDLPTATNYLASLFGGGTVQPGMELAAGVIYQPHLVVALLLAASIAWISPQTWDFTRRLSGPKAAYCLMILLLSLALMETQSYNPFIYFLF